MKVLSGHTVTPLEGEERTQHEEVWQGYSQGLVRLIPGRWLFPTDYVRYADKLYQFKFRTNDVVVMTWPKCGTTWMQEIVWTMRNNPDLNSPDGGKPINVRVPFVDTDMFLRSSALPEPDQNSSVANEFARLCPGRTPADGLFLQMAETMQSPRTIKTHLPFSLFLPTLLGTAKVVYVARNPKDVVVSYYHHSRLFKSIGYKGTFRQFLKFFLDDDLVYGPYWLHLKEAWEKRDHPNMHFVFYEDLKADTMTELKKLNDFLGTGLTQEQLENVKKYTSFEEMKARDNIFKGTKEEDVYTNTDVTQQDGGFYRSGVVGGWTTRLTQDQAMDLDLWVDKHLNHLGIRFPRE